MFFCLFFYIGRLESTLCVLALYEPVFDSLIDMTNIRIYINIYYNKNILQ